MFYYRSQAFQITFVLLGGVTSLLLAEDRATETTPVTKFQATPLHAEGLHNLFRVSEQLYSGSQPEGEIGFASLKQFGIKTVISVDGALPDVETAHKFELKYVHLPIGYDGIPRKTMLMLAQAARILPGPIYVHCHHGKHRGPAAVAAIRLCNEKKCTAIDAIRFMEQAQTDPKYRGLYAVPKEFQPPTVEELKAVPTEFSEVATVENLTALMARIDHEFEMLLTLTQGESPLTREEYVQSVVLLNEHLREIERLPETMERSEAYRKDLQEGIAISRKLHELLEESDAVATLCSKQVNLLKSCCTRCHTRERDNPGH